LNSTPICFTCRDQLINWLDLCINSKRQVVDPKGQERNFMNTDENNNDQFQLLEEKIDKLIGLIKTLKGEKTSLAEKARIQEEKVAGLTVQIESLKAAREKAKEKILSLLDKIEEIDM
jgi:predicted nuclease with TOPRIM domain